MSFRSALPILGALFAATASVACQKAFADSPDVGSTRPSEISISAEQAKGAKIDTVPVTERPVETVLKASGRMAFDDLKVAHIFSPITGKVTSISAGLGQHLKAGDTLATVVSPDIGQWSSDMVKANADLTAAEHDFKRKTDLLAVNAVARADYEASKDAYRQAKAEKTRAEEKVRLLGQGGVDLVGQSYSLRTPIEGDVIARMVNPGIEIQGQYDNASTQNELFTVGDLSSLWMFADVYEADVPRLQQGAKVYVTTLALEGRTFEGTVDWISGALDPATRTVRVRCVLPNPDRLLKPDMYTTARINVPERDAVSVPRSAVVHYGEQQVVFVEENSAGGKRHFVRLPVKVDERVEGDWLPVETGIEKGAQVVSGGAQAIADWMM